MRLKRPLVLVPAAIAILALAAIAFVWLGARTAFARRIATDWIEDATGLPAAIESMRVGLLPRPVLALEGFTLAQPPGFDAAALIEVGAARVEIPWSGLFGAPAVESAIVTGAVVRPAFAADGSNNWSGLIERLAELGGEGESAWSIGRLAVEQGALEFSDAASGSTWRLTAITIAADDIAPAVEFPLELRLAAVTGDNTIHFGFSGRGHTDPVGGRHELRGLQFRGWAGGEPLPLAGVELLGTLALASYDAAAGIAVVGAGTFNLAGIPGEFAGSMDLDEPQTVMTFAVKTDSFAPRAPAVSFGFPLPATTDPEAFGSLRLSFDGRLQDEVLYLDPISGQLDDSAFEGRAIPGQRLIRLAIDRIDVDRYLAPEQKSRQEKKATLEALVAELGQFDIDAEIRVGEARVAGARLRDTVIRVEREGGAGP